MAKRTVRGALVTTHNFIQSIINWVDTIHLLLIRSIINNFDTSIVLNSDSGVRIIQTACGLVWKDFDVFGRSACDYWAEEFKYGERNRRLGQLADFRSLYLEDESASLIQSIINDVYAISFWRFDFSHGRANVVQTLKGLGSCSESEELARNGT